MESRRPDVLSTIRSKCNDGKAFNDLQELMKSVPQTVSLCASDRLQPHVTWHLDTWTLKDTLAERITALGGTAHGTLATVSRTTTLAPYPDDITDGIQHVDALSSAVANFGAKVRKAIDESARAGDADTSDLFTGMSREVDKDLWFLEAHLYRQR